MSQIPPKTTLESTKTSADLQRDILKQVLEERRFYLNIATFGFSILGWLTFQYFILPRYLIRYEGDGLPEWFFDLVAKIKVGMPIFIGVGFFLLAMKGIKTLVLGSRWQDKKMRERLNQYIIHNEDLHESLKQNLKTAILEGRTDNKLILDRLERLEHTISSESRGKRNGMQQPHIEPIPPTKRIRLDE